MGTVSFTHSLHTVNSTTLILCSEASTEMLINWRIKIVVFGSKQHKGQKKHKIRNPFIKIQCRADIKQH